MADDNHAPHNQRKCNVDGDENKSSVVLHTFIQWCNKVNESPEDCQPIHDKMLELLAQAKHTSSPPHLNNEKMEEKKFKNFFRVYVKRVNVLKKYVSQRQELNMSDYNFMLKSLNELKSDTIILEAMTKDYMKTKSLRPKTLSELSSKINQLCQTLDKALNSDNGEKK